MNHIDSNLKLIKQKIDHIKVGIFKPETDNEIDLPSNVVHVINVDELGNIWFQTSCKNFHVHNVGKTVYAYMDFKSKDFNSHIIVSGPAQITEVTNSDLSIPVEAKQSNNILLIKLKIMNAEFLELNKTPEGSIFNKIKGVFQQAFFHGQHKQFQFQ